MQPEKKFFGGCGCNPPKPRMKVYVKTIGKRDFLVCGSYCIPVDTILEMFLTNTDGQCFIRANTDYHFRGDDAEVIREFFAKDV